MERVRVGIIGGAGLMGKMHSAAYAALPVYFGKDGFLPERIVLCDENLERARLEAENWGWAEACDKWQEVVERDDIDMIDIVTPNDTHKEIVLAAIECGKKLIYCEKPLSVSGNDAKEMWEAAEKAGVKTAVAYNRRRWPAVIYAKQLIEEGFIGNPLYIKGTYLTSDFRDPTIPLAWRFSKAKSGSGALGDIGSHTFDTIRYLLGDFDELVSVMDTYIHERPSLKDPDKMEKVDVDDAAFFIAKLKNGVTVTLDSSRYASGKVESAGFEVFGTKGAIRWNATSRDELEICMEDSPKDQYGFKVIEMGPNHPFGLNLILPVGAWGVGGPDNKALEIYDFLMSVRQNTPFQADFYDGWKACQIIDAAIKSAETKAWVKVDEI